MDGGNSWQNIFPSAAGSVPGWSALAPSNHDVLYIHTYSTVYRTTNATSATPTFQALDASCQGTIITAVDPTNPDIAYFVGNPTGGVLKTTNGGQLCFQISPLHMAVSTEFGNGGRLYGITQNPWAIYTSDDGGTTWTQKAGNGFPTGQNIWGFAVDPHDRNHLLISATNYGIRESKDGGDNWNPLNNGYPIGSERNVIVGFDNPPTYYATTNGNGVWQYHVGTTLFSQPHANYTIVINKNTNCDYGATKCAGKPPNIYHTGIDSYDSASPNTSVPILAAAPGIVAKIQLNGPTGCKPSQGTCLDHGLGNTVILEHSLTNGDKIYTQYSHLHTIASGLTEGVTCAPQGFQIGTMGGTAYGKEDLKNIHLHFEFKDSPVLGAPLAPNLYWGYTPTYPDNWGYHDPKLYVGKQLAEVICQ